MYYSKRLLLAHFTIWWNLGVLLSVFLPLVIQVPRCFQIRAIPFYGCELTLDGPQQIELSRSLSFWLLIQLANEMLANVTPAEAWKSTVHLALLILARLPPDNYVLPWTLCRMGKIKMSIINWLQFSFLCVIMCKKMLCDLQSFVQMSIAYQIIAILIMIMSKPSVLLNILSLRNGWCNLMKTDKE